MAGFKTHITFSGFLGVGYGAAGYLLYDVPLPTSVLAGGLCGLAGMLPDLDSDSGVPVREATAFGAAVIPLLMVERFQHVGLAHEEMVLAGALIYLVIRFGLFGLLKRYTVHRGMWHSVPAALIAGLLGFLICSCEDQSIRLYRAGGMSLGYLSHLVLDEFYSFEWKRGRLRLKKSFGTALKFFSRNTWSNISTYGKLAFVLFLAVGDPLMMERLGYYQNQAHHLARDTVDQVLKTGEKPLH